MRESIHRRTTSEIDITSLRRISDALLLAQNRACRATDRANQTEHVLRLVLAQIDVPRRRVDSLIEQDMLRTTLMSNSFLFMLNRGGQGRTLFDDVVGSDSVTTVPSSISLSFSLENVAKKVVDNLNIAMTRHKRYVDQLTLPTLWSLKDGGLFCLGPVHFVLGFLAGVVVGVVLTEQWQLQLLHTHKETPSLFGKVAKWYSRRVSVARTPWHLMSMDEYGNRTYLSTFEVA